MKNLAHSASLAAWCSTVSPHCGIKHLATLGPEAAEISPGVSTILREQVTKADECRNAVLETLRPDREAAHAELLRRTISQARSRLRPDAPKADVAQTHADIEACDRALRELVTAIVAYDVAAAPALDPSKPIEIRMLGDTDLASLTLESLTTHPVRHALREGVKRIGREVYRLGGSTSAMLDSMVKVAEMDQAQSMRRSSIINAAWDGIGAGDDRWRA